MLLRSISLTNFRQYRGVQKVEFSCCNDRNVTVILGDNTSGKSTLVQAFTWALYGTASFSSQELLNMDLSQEMVVGHSHPVYVEICLRHNDTEYIVTRKQEYRCQAKGLVKAVGGTHLTVSYKATDGQIESIRYSEVESAVKRILPEDLANYFFFDGERIGSISSKQDVTEAVKGLLGLATLDNAMKHLDPSRKGSVVGKFKSGMDLAGNQKAQEALQRIQTEQQRREDILGEVDRIKNEMSHYEQRKESVEATLRDNQETARLQERKEDLERLIKADSAALDEAYARFFAEFNTHTVSFFAQPLIQDALELLRQTQVADKGVPNMNATSIDFLIARGRCLCGHEIKEGNEAHRYLINERSFLPPQSIGTMIRTFIDQWGIYSSTGDRYLSSVESRYSDIYRYKTRIQEWEDEVEQISQKIRGKSNVKKYEDELRDIKARLRDFATKKENLTRDDGGCVREIERTQKFYDSLVGVSEKNRRIQLFTRYAEALYDWIKCAYDAKESEIRSLLENRVTHIFNEMYHGRRQVIIDSKYRVSLLTHYAAESVHTDESRGLETVKNFAFIAGLVDLARQKIIGRTGEEDLQLSSEPYPLVMDAPFSNADERHVSNISNLLPKIAEQVIILVTFKDWSFAEPVMAGRVGRTYVLDKQSETMTIVRER